MKLLINIPKEIYDVLYVDYVFKPERNEKTLFSILQKCIANGMQLPEHLHLSTFCDIDDFITRLKMPLWDYDINGHRTWYLPIMCSNCGFKTTAIEGHTEQYRYCPSCGMEMEKEGEDNA